jgi:hypothetical protein
MKSLNVILYRMIRSLCTWWLQYKNTQKSYCLAADRQGQGGTRLTLTPSVIHNSNYVIMVNDWKCLKYFCVFLDYNYQVHRVILHIAVLRQGTVHAKQVSGREMFPVRALYLSLCCPKNKYVAYVLTTPVRGTGTGMRRILTFRSTTDRIYVSGPIIL